MDHPKKNRTIIAISLLIIAFDGIVVGGLLFHIPILRDILSGFAAMNVNAVLCLLLFGTALFFIQNRLMGADLEKIVRQRTEDFKKSEERYYSLIEHASDAIYVLDPERNFTHVNDSLCKMTGYSREELLKMRVEAVIDPDELKNDPLPDRQLQSAIRERKFKRKNGEIFTVEVNVKMFTDDMILVIARDITDRKNAEDIILREKMLSDTIINSLPGIFYLQNDKGQYLRWNKNFETVTGYTADEITHLAFTDLIVEEDHELVAKAIERVYSDGYAMLEAGGKTKDGNVIPYLLTGSPVIYQNQRCLLGTGIDISQRIKAEEELKTSEFKYKQLFESNPSPMWMIAKDDLSVIAYNEAAAKLYGYTKDELINKSATIFRPAEDLALQQERYKNDIKNTDLAIVRHLKKDGTIIYVQIIAHDIIFEGRPVRLSMTKDVTEQLQAEESLQKSEANLQTILKTTNTAYLLFDLDLKLLEFNQTAARLINEQYGGITSKGGHFSSYFPSDKFSQFINFATDALNGNIINHELRYAQGNGKIFWYYVRLFPITNDNKDILGLMMALYDITERKTAEQDLKDAYDRIQDHMDSIKKMAWKQSHLIRSPLANLKGLMNLISDDPTDLEALAHIQNELDRMDSIILEMADEASDS